MQLLGLIMAFIAVVVIGIVFSSTNAPPSADESVPVSEERSDVDESTPTSGTEEPSPVPSSVGSVEIYDGISVPRNTTIVDVSGRGLEGSLKAEIRQLAQLEVLDMSRNSLTGIPAEVGQLTNLRILNLSNNPFTGLPREIGNLQNLEELDLRGTNYSEQDLAVIRESLPDSTVLFID